jgi:MbtH protein
MTNNEQNDETIYLVVVNHEEQYSIWPKWKQELPLGWKAVGKEASKTECLAYIEEAWTDMRPLSLRQAMQESSNHSVS